MRDTEISLNSMASYALWAVGVVLIVPAFLVDDVFGNMAVFCAVGAGTLSVRGYFCNLADREQAAFELGRGSPESIHSVD